MTEKGGEMSEINTGGPAFPGQPTLHSPTGYKIEAHNGMTLRDYFAAKAMQGYLIAPDTGWNFDEIVAASYKMADAMLEARK